MPFTLSHPAAVLPLVGRGRLAAAGASSALVLGSMAPDLPYYLGLGGAREVTHTLPSVAWFSVPAGLAMWLTFQHLVKTPLVFLLPRALRTRIDPAPVALRPVPVTLGLALGAATHLLWDAFTHEAGPALRGVPALQEIAGSARSVRIWAFHVLQHGSTLGGALAVGLWTRAWLRRTPSRPDPRPLSLPAAWRRPLRGGLLLTPPAVGLAVAFALAPPRPEARVLAHFLAHLAVASISSAVLLLAGLGLMARLRRAQPGA